MTPDFERIAEASPDGISRFDKRGRFIYVNATTEQMLGRGRDEILGKTNAELGVPDALARQADADIQAVLHDGKQRVRTYSYPDGERYYEARLIPERDGQGVVNAVLVMSRDVTDRVGVEGNLRRQRDLAEEVIDTVREPMLVLDSEFRVSSANGSFERYFGVDADEVRGRALDEVVSGRFDVPGLESLLGRVLTPGNGTFEGFDIDLTLPDKGRRTIRLNARQIDHLQLILLAMEDVTDQIEAFSALEKEVQSRNEELEDQARRLRELVVELSETEDRERQRLADLLHDDLQQVLVGAAFHLEMVESRCKDDSKTASLVAKAKELISDVIARSRTLSHELSPAAFRNQGLKGGLDWLAQQMKRRHALTVELSVEGDMDAMADSVRVLLYKAIREMLFNIVKHAQVDEAHVSVTRRDEQVEVVVRDHGKGFDVEAVLNNKSGTGLGIFSIRERLNLLGGQLDVQSTEGAGSRFHMRIPLHSDVVEEASERQARLEQGRDSDEYVAGDGRLRLLIVDDHAVVRQGIAKLLEEHPEIEVLGEAEDGKSALNWVGEHRPDVVLVDFTMPEMDGAEVTRRIKTSWPDVRVVGLSMCEEDTVARRMLQAGAEAYVQKTAPASELLSRILVESRDAPGRS
jgi:PAS domain S-box-containing protein